MSYHCARYDTLLVYLETKVLAWGGGSQGYCPVDDKELAIRQPIDKKKLSTPPINLKTLPSPKFFVTKMLKLVRMFCETS